MQKNSSLWVKVALVACMTLVPLGSAAIVAALPKISQFFSENPDAEFLSKSLLSVNSLFMVIGAPTFGLLANKIDKRYLLIFAMLAYSLFGTVGLYIENLYWLVISRAGVGITIGGIMTVVVALIGDYYEGTERIQFMGTANGMSLWINVVYIILGGFLADISWRHPFMMYGLGIITAFWSILFLPKPLGNNSSSQNTVPNHGNFTLSPLLIGIYFLIFWGMAIMYVFIIQASFIFAQYGFTGTKTSLGVATFLIAGAITSMSYKRIKNRLSYPLIYVIIFAGLFVGGILMVIPSNIWVFILGVFASGGFYGLLLPNTNLWIMELVPLNLRPRFLSFSTTSYFLGLFCSVPILQFAQEQTGSVQGGIAVFAVSSIIVAIIVFFSTRHLSQKIK